MNLAADGAHYWVFAHVTPSYGPDGSVVGYHSSRRNPAPAALAAVRPLYEQVLAEERRHDSARSAVAASVPLLQRLVTDRAPGYEEFVWSITPEEHAAAGVSA